MYEIISETTYADHIHAEELEKLYLPSEVIASPLTTWAWGQKNDEGLFLLREIGSREPLGHLSAFPVCREISMAMMAGKLHDTELPEAAILPYGSIIPADLYFAVICVHKTHRPKGSRALLLHFMKFLNEKMEKGLCENIENFFAEAGTANGQRLLERRGFSKTHPNSAVPCYYKSRLVNLVKDNVGFINNKY